MYGESTGKETSGTSSLTGRLRVFMDKKKQKKSKKRKNKQQSQKWLLGGGIVLCLIVLVVIIVSVLQSFGKNSLKKHGDSMLNNENAIHINSLDGENAESTYELEEGQVVVDGQVYEYNDEIITFLCMGIDSHSGISKTKTPGRAGQADALILVVMDPKKEEIQIINVNRDSMTDIEIYDTAGVYLGRERGQITLLYAYGDGREKSCELMEQAVSELFYGIPIHGYIALDILAIATLNDAVGGVNVTVDEDVAMYMPQWKVGETVTLKGEEALYYVRHRAAETGELGTNIRRIDRQKEFMAAFLQALKNQTKGNLSFPLSLYSKIEKHIVTSVSIEEITYLANMALSFDLSFGSMRGMNGDIMMGEESEEFHVNDAYLKQLVMDVFYQKVK